MPAHRFTFLSFLWRLGFALLLVLLTYNPSGYSWVGALNAELAMVYKVAAGIVLLIGWVMFLRATWNSLGAVGTSLAAAFFGVIIWLLIEWNILSLDSATVFQWVFSLGNTTVLQWALLLITACVLAVGMSWSHVRRRLSGQYDTDEIEG